MTDGLAARFGEERVFDTPLAEAGIIGTAIGMAMNGLVPVVEMQFDAFAYPAFEQVTSHLAKLRNRTRGRVSLPIVVRIPYGGGIGGVEHHSDASEAYYVHTPGLRVVTPGGPANAYHLLRQSIACADPVIFLEPKLRYWSKEPIPAEDIGDYMAVAGCRGWSVPRRAATLSWCELPDPTSGARRSGYYRLRDNLDRLLA